MTPDTVLIIDDDQTLGKFTAEVLTLAGYNVEVSTLGRDGLERLTCTPSRYQAVLLDRRMPDLDGLTILRRLKGDVATRDIPVVLLTGLTSEQDIIAGIEAGAYYYVTKPFRETMLQAVLRAAIDEFRARRDVRHELTSTTGAAGLLQRGEFRFRTPSEARGLAGLLAHCTNNPSSVVTGLWELLINAVEHGNLGISYAEKSSLLATGQWQDEITQRLNDASYGDRCASLTVTNDKHQVVYTVADEGPGFDPTPYLEFDPSRATHAHGRGIAMARRMSFTSIEYLGTGNRVRATAPSAHHPLTDR